MPLTLPCLVRPSDWQLFARSYFAVDHCLAGIFQESEYGAPAPFIARAWARASGGFAPALALALSIAMGLSIFVGWCFVAVDCFVTGRLIHAAWLFRVNGSCHSAIQSLDSCNGRHPGNIAHARALCAHVLPYCYTEMPARLSRSVSAVPKQKQGGHAAGRLFRSLDDEVQASLHTVSDVQCLRPGTARSGAVTNRGLTCLA